MSNKINELQELRNIFHSWDIVKKQQFIASLSPIAFNQFAYYSDCLLRPDQQIPEGNWRYFVAQCARGWGKTKLGAHEIAKEVYAGRGGLAIVVPAYKDIEDYIIEAITNEFPAHQKPRYIGGDKQHFICYNGIKIRCYSSDKEVRGSNLRTIWCDEFCAWCEKNEEKATERFNVMDFALRKGKSRFIITTTPRPWKIMKDWNEMYLSGDPLTQMIYGETKDNYFLTNQAIDSLYKKYAGTRLGDQELHGKILPDLEGALWKWGWINDNRKQPDDSGLNLPLFAKEDKEWLTYIIIAVDPAGSAISETSDETGIVVAAVSNKGHGYVLADCSGKYSPNAMAQKVKELYYRYKANKVVIERNFGGDHVSNTIRNLDCSISIKEIVASRGKMIRAEPVSAKYEQNLVHHVGKFDKLENQMCAYMGLASTSKRKDDRMDALVFALTELLITPVYIERKLSNLPDFR